MCVCVCVVTVDLSERPLNYGMYNDCFLLQIVCALALVCASVSSCKKGSYSKVIFQIVSAFGLVFSLFAPIILLTSAKCVNKMKHHKLLLGVGIEHGLPVRFL